MPQHTSHRIIGRFASLVAAVGLSVTASGCIEEEDEEAPDFAVFDPAGSVSIQDALGAAVAHRGGFASEAELEQDDGEFLYSVVVFHDGALWEYEIDADSGSVLAFAPEDDNANPDRVNRTAEFDQDMFVVSAADAVDIAMSQNAVEGGFPVEVELDIEDIEFSWDVYVFVEGVFWEVEINPADGAVSTELADDYPD